MISVDSPDVMALVGTALRAVIGAPRWLMTELGQALPRLGEGDAMVLVLAYALGLVHAATPGHGKSVVLTYFVGYKARPWAGLAMGLKIALSHVGAALAVFIVLRLILDRTMRGMNDSWLPTISYGGITMVGLFLTWQALRANHTHTHGPTARDRGVLPLLIGLVPCPITLSVLFVAVSQGQVAASLLLALVMALGMATTLTGVALLAILLRASVASFLERHAGLMRAMEVAGAAAITLIGLALFWGALTRPKGLPF
ncbi:MAG: hypothetical protein H7Z12_03565 [Rhodospirillaceae bacterium]|nr:hypothetical protein [Rhodospirillales bacterium]